MIYQHLLKGIERFGGSGANVCRLAFKCEPEVIEENVILSPIWEVDIFAPYVDQVTPVTKGIRKLDQLSVAGRKITYICSGPGSPAVAHAVMALSCSPCRNIIFAGAVGGLVPGFEAGDVIIPEYSVCGDGASRYLTDGSVKDNDCFGVKYYPDLSLYAKLTTAAESVCLKYKASWHRGRTFSVDNIFAEYAHLEEILEMGCDSIEMESALLFRSAEISGIKAGAVFYVTDNSFSGSAIYSGGIELHRERGEYIRNNIITRIVLEALREI
jgi:uridine phosphorylase